MDKIQDLRSITPRSNGTRRLSYVNRIARHHSGSQEGEWKTFWRYWNGSKGWGTGGYHEIILRDGTVQLCYDAHEITNGVRNNNSRTYHISLVGNGSFTAVQEVVFKERCLRAMKLFNLKPQHVLGHNEFPGQSTSCPGINMNDVRRSLTNSSLPGKPIDIDPMDKGYLMSGDIGKSVGTLQANLNKHGKFKKITVDNIFGKDTQNSLISFQKQFGLKVDGYFGKEVDAKFVALEKDNSVTLQKWFRVRKTWEDSKSQLSAHLDLQDAVDAADKKKVEGYKVYDPNGKLVYTPSFEVEGAGKPSGGEENMSPTTADLKEWQREDMAKTYEQAYADGIFEDDSHANEVRKGRMELSFSTYLNTVIVGALLNNKERLR